MLDLSKKKKIFSVDVMEVIPNSIQFYLPLYYKTEDDGVIRYCKIDEKNTFIIEFHRFGMVTFSKHNSNFKLTQIQKEGICTKEEFDEAYKEFLNYVKINEQ